jgi:hypothetical protein
MMPQLQMRIQLMAQAQGKPTVHQMPQQFAVTTSYVAFQQNRLLTAVDPLTGQTLWMRDDLPVGCDMFGDEALLLVTPPEGTSAYVLSGVDGRELGRKEVPARNVRLLQHGHSLLTWEERDGQRELKLVDPWAGSVPWSRKFPAKAAVWPVGGSEVAVFEPDGKFALLAVADGSAVLEAKLDAMPQMDSMFALRNTRRLLLFVNLPEPKQEGPVFWNQVMPGHLKVEGKVFSFDVAGGRQQWVSEVTRQSIKANYPTLAPILTFFRRDQKAVKMDNNSWRSDQPSVHVRCLDSRSGATVHDSKIEKTYDEGYRLQVDPGSGKVEVSTRLETVTLEYQKGT